MKTVLIADDDPITSAVITETLEEGEYRVIYARDGKECVDMAVKYNPDLIILDVIMPVMDGVEALAEVRKTSDAPVVIMSAFGNSEKVERARELGIECFISKPFDPDVLIELFDVIFLAE